MKKIILYSTLLIIFLSSAQHSFSYELKVKNFNYVASNILEFEIFMKGPAPQYYWMGQYIFNFNPAFANGGNLTYTIRNFSDLPNAIRPPVAGINNGQLRLSTNLPLSFNTTTPFVPYTLSVSGDGTKIIRVRLTTTACSFAGNLNLTWRNASDGGYYTKVYDADYEAWDPNDPDIGYRFISITNVANSGSNSVDPIPPASIANVLVNPGCGGFPTLKDAFTAINTNTGGIYTNQNVTVSIVNNTTETSSAVLNGGIFTSCNIKPSNNSITVTAASGVQELIVLDGADNVTIDGRVGGAGAVQLTVSNPNTGTSNCIKMLNGALNNTVKYLNSVCSGLNTDAYNIYIAGTNSNLTPTGNDNNKIESCVIDGGYTGIYVIGHPIVNTGTKINTGTIILNNEIKNFKTIGIKASFNTKSNRIESNKVTFGSAIFNPNEVYLEGIICYGIGENYIIRNKIYSTTNPIIHTYYFGIEVNPIITQQAVNTTSNYILNNFVSISDDAAGYIYGMYCGNSGAVALTANIEHNTVYIGKTGTSLAGFSTGIGIYNMGVAGAICNFYNNLSINERFILTNVPGWAIEIQPNPVSTLNADYNCYWSLHNFVIWSGVNYIGLSAYQTAAFPNEQNTILKNINFTDKVNGDLHLSGASVSDYELIGKSGTGVTNDFDLDTRDALFPYKGADESTLLSVSGGATTLNLKCYAEGFYNSATNIMTKIIPATVSLRRSVSPYTIVSSVSTNLDVNGNANSLSFNIPYPGTYYIVVKNWNMVTTWTLVPQSFTVGATTNYDFSAAVNQAFGNNLKQVDDTPARWGVYEGDVNQDGSVNNTDLTSVHSASTSYSTGNIVTDLTGDEIIDVDDLLIVRNNEANAVIVVKP